MAPGRTRQSRILFGMKDTTLPWQWMVTEISTSLTIVITVAATCACQAALTASGKTKRLTAQATRGIVLISPLTHRVRFTSCISISMTRKSTFILAHQEVGRRRRGSLEDILGGQPSLLIQTMPYTFPIILEAY